MCSSHIFHHCSQFLADSVALRSAQNDFILLSLRPLHRSIVFHKLPQLTVALRQRVCPFLDGMLRSAMHPDVDPASITDARLVVR